MLAKHSGLPGQMYLYNNFTHILKRQSFTYKMASMIKHRIYWEETIVEVPARGRNMPGKAFFGISIVWHLEVE